jgi:hypothetical protein
MKKKAKVKIEVRLMMTTKINMKGMEGNYLPIPR